jgi:hypothetical protein
MYPLKKYAIVTIFIKFYKDSEIGESVWVNLWGECEEILATTRKFSVFSTGMWFCGF